MKRRSWALAVGITTLLSGHILCNVPAHCGTGKASSLAGAGDQILYASTATKRSRIIMEATLTQIQDRTEALQTLGLSSNDASNADVKRAFRHKVRTLHPDRRGASPVDDERLARVLEAYAVLTGRRGFAHSEAPSSQSGIWNTWAKSRHRKRTEEDVFREYEESHKKPGNWRWSQTTGFNPNDLEEVWDEIGYNPYTGAYHAPKVSDPEDPSTWPDTPNPQPRTSYQSSSASAPRYTSTAAATSSVSTTESIDAHVTLQVLGYALFVVAIAMYADSRTFLGKRPPDNQLEPMQIEHVRSREDLRGPADMPAYRKIYSFPVHELVGLPTHDIDPRFLAAMDEAGADEGPIFDGSYF